MSLIKISDDFYNFRGSFSIMCGLIELGTHCSLVHRPSTGKWVFIDSYTLTHPQKQQVDALTNNGQDIEAIINVHPFHTLHCKPLHELYPHAKLYGTQRHIQKQPTLPWQQELTETPKMHALYSDLFEFSVPKGVDFISKDESVHFSSVLVYHMKSKTLHVDDTFSRVNTWFISKLMGSDPSRLALHPTLKKALEKRAGAVSEFRQWVTHVADTWGAVAENVCVAHRDSFILCGGGKVGEMLKRALSDSKSTLDAHEKQYH
eukprot:GDKI01034751.1.p1 GENE.GDKI01034751.1~~GDKI01034751.1.p1  ORF type:complete len:299 (+),score=87.40 GDKI01034751.1:116-898(+)